MRNDFLPGGGEVFEHSIAEEGAVQWTRVLAGEVPVNDGLRDTGKKGVEREKRGG